VFRNTVNVCLVAYLLTCSVTVCFVTVVCCWVDASADRDQSTRAIAVWALEELWREERDRTIAQQNAKAEAFTVQVWSSNIV